MSTENKVLSKNKIKMFIAGNVDKVHGHPECLQKKVVLNVFKTDEWSQLRVLVFEDEGHLILKWGDSYR